MSKRSKSIASIFAARPEADELSADNSAARPTRVSSGSVRSMKESFSQVERENEALRQSLSEGGRIVEIDPALIDPSPFADRFPDDDDPSSFEALTASIAENGQEVPVLLRVHPHDPDRYQTAFGHRRIRAARALRRPVRAVVRAMDDAALAVAQGVENSAREDLTFIERAVFAARLEDAGQSRQVIGQALGVDKAETSKLVAIARAVPQEILRHVGRAPKVGRTRWQALVEALKGEGAGVRVARHLFQAAGGGGLGSDDRFVALLAAARVPSEDVPVERSILSHAGRRVATLVAGGRDARLLIDRDVGPDFARFLAERLPELYEAFAADRGETEPRPHADGSRNSNARSR